MSKTTIDVLFKKQQKDDKKEILQFEYRPDENDGQEAAVVIYNLSGQMINFHIKESEAGWSTAEFAKLNKDSNKSTMNFALKGDSEAKAIMLYKHAGHHVTLSIEPAQADLTEQLDEKKDDHEGIEYTTDLSGVVNIQSKLEKAPDKAETPEAETDLEEDELPF